MRTIMRDDVQIMWRWATVKDGGRLLYDNFAETATVRCAMLPEKVDYVAVGAGSLAAQIFRVFFPYDVGQLRPSAALLAANKPHAESKFYFNGVKYKDRQYNAVEPFPAGTAVRRVSEFTVQGINTGNVEIPR